MPLGNVDAAGRISTHIVCRHCGTDLFGISARGYCGKCGRPAAESVDVPGTAVALDEQQRLVHDLACAKCGYNLRGLPVDGRCPECGTSVGRAVHGDLMRWSDPEWVERLAFGATLVLWSFALALVVGIAGAVLTAIVNTPALTAVVGVAASLVGVYGTWLVTAPDPSGRGEDRYGRARRIARFGVVAALAGNTIGEAQHAPVAFWLSIAAIVISALLNLVALVGSWFLFRYLELLLMRIPNPGLAQRARVIRWGLVICLGVMLVAGAFGGIAAAVIGVGPGAAAPTPTAPDGCAATGGPAAPPLAAALALIPAGCIAALAGLGMLVFGIMTIILYWQSRQQFLAQATRARQVWAG